MITININNSTWVCLTNSRCKVSLFQLYINLVVNYTDDYDPVVKNGLSFEIFEVPEASV